MVDVDDVDDVDVVVVHDDDDLARRRAIDT